MTKTELAYLAGFWEGEGSCGCYNRRAIVNGKPYSYKNRTLAADMSQKYKNVLVWTRSKLGYGWIYKAVKCKKFGTPIFTWRCTQQNAYSFLTSILPFMHSPYRRKQIATSLRKWSQYAKD